MLEKKNCEEEKMDLLKVILEYLDKLTKFKD